MAFSVVWMDACSADILGMHYEDASALIAEVTALARGERDVEILERDDGQEFFCLPAEAGVALVRLIGSTIHVVRLVANHPLPRTYPLLDAPEPPESD